MLLLLLLQPGSQLVSSMSHLNDCNCPPPSLFRSWMGGLNGCPSARVKATRSSSVCLSVLALACHWCISCLPLFPPPPTLHVRGISSDCSCAYSKIHIHSHTWELILKIKPSARVAIYVLQTQTKVAEAAAVGTMPAVPALYLNLAAFKKCSCYPCIRLCRPNEKGPFSSLVRLFIPLGKNLLWGLEVDFFNRITLASALPLSP